MQNDFKTNLKTFIIDRARSLGFDAVGVTTPASWNPQTSANLAHWLGQGYQAGMAWMVNHLSIRSDPARLMENTRSIVCVAMNYHQPRENRELKIAQYAQGSDYHKVVKKQLKKLLKDIQQFSAAHNGPEIRGRPLTDSAPIMEKPLAVQAGLGWIAKNGNVILPNKGSYYFLGELLLDIELAPDLPFETNHCGHCTRCIDACPTDAIVQDGVIDANRCLSYWTIEYKGGAFPAEIQKNLNGWIFGCDICQDVCPWNLKFATLATEPLFQSRPWNVSPDADEILALTPEEFHKRYAGSPINRVKREGIQRNVREATGDL